MDLLIRGGRILTCNAQNETLVGDVLVRNDTIVAIGDLNQIPTSRCTRVLDAHGAAIIPGFVQTHVHLVQTLFRGMADDLPLLEWLKSRIWPLEAAHTEKSLRASAMLALAELIRGGTTTILDMGTTHQHEVILDTIAQVGIRAFSGKALMDSGEGVPNKLRENRHESLRELEAHAVQYQGHQRISVVMSPRFILSCSEALIREGAMLAKDRELLMHTHASEHAEERQFVVQTLGDSDINVLARWGLTGARTVLAHCVQATLEEQQTMAKAGTRVAHCPSANLKLGSGIAPVQAFYDAGVVVGLGADGAPCNNNLDALVELRHAALLSKIKAGPASLVATQALRLATIEGAKVLGIDQHVGSIEPGKQADLVVIDLEKPHAEPGGDATSRVVYTSRTEDIRHVVMQGIVRVKDHKLVDLDQESIVAEARTESEKLCQRAGLHSNARHLLANAPLDPVAFVAG